MLCQCFSEHFLLVCLFGGSALSRFSVSLSLCDAIIVQILNIKCFLFAFFSFTWFPYFLIKNKDKVNLLYTDTHTHTLNLHSKCYGKKNENEILRCDAYNDEKLLFSGFFLHFCVKRKKNSGFRFSVGCAQISLFAFNSFYYRRKKKKKINNAHNQNYYVITLKRNGSYNCATVYKLGTSWKKKITPGFITGIGSEIGFLFIFFGKPKQKSSNMQIEVK